MSGRGTGSRTTFEERAGARAWIVVGLWSVVAFSLVLLATRDSPGVSPDSVSYIAAARNLANGRGLVDFDGTPFNHWPPGLPAVLAVFETAGIGVVDGARLLNAALLAGTVVLAYLLIRRHVRSTTVTLFGTALVAVSPALLRNTDMVWSEPLFTVLVLTFVLVLESACRTQRWTVLAGAGVVASCAALVRYLGIAVVLAGAIAIFVVALRSEAKGALLRATWFSFWASLGPALWAIYNLAESEPALGRQVPGTESVPQVVRDLALGLGQLVVPEGVPDVVVACLGVAVVAIVLGGAWTAVRTGSWPELAPVLSVVCTTMVFAVVSAVRANSDVSARIFAPFLPLLVVIALWLFERWIGATHRMTRHRTVVISGMIGLAWFSVWALGMAWAHGRNSTGYAEGRWVHSELSEKVRTLPADAVVSSNVPYAVAYNARREPVSLFAPGSEHVATWVKTMTRRELERAACLQPTYLAWFGDRRPGFGRAVATASDGVLLEIEPGCP